MSNDSQAERYRKERKDSSKLKEILSFCEKIERAQLDYTKGLSINDEVYTDAMFLYISEIGDISKHLSQSFKNRNSDFDWEGLYALRNSAIHAYGKVAPSRIWDTIKIEIPRIKQICEQELSIQKSQNTDTYINNTESNSD